MAIKTLSIPADMEEFLSENRDLSPSKMLQSKIIEIRENRKIYCSPCLDEYSHVHPEPDTPVP